MPTPTHEEIKLSFNKAAKHYDAHAFIQNVIGQRLLDRLDMITAPFPSILDAGCGTGYFSTRLRQRFPQSAITSIDVAHNMTRFAKARKSTWLQRKIQYTTGNIAQLPFKDNVFDLIFCNLVMHWSDVPKTLAEYKRVLKANGLLLFTLPGPDTLSELSQAFQAFDTYQHVNAFYDMHDIGDCLQAERFLNAVVDMEKITFEYDSVWSILKDLKMTGVRNIHPDRRTHLSPKHHLDALVNAYPQTATQKYPVSFEVIYGHAVCPCQKATSTPYQIPLKVIS